VVAVESRRAEVGAVSSSTKARACPLCELGVLTHHCPSPTCGWHKCVPRDDAAKGNNCRAVLYLTRRSGFRQLASERYERVTLKEAS
jgi:hypothetical protein